MIMMVFIGVPVITFMVIITVIIIVTVITIANDQRLKYFLPYLFTYSPFVYNT